MLFDVLLLLILVLVGIGLVNTMTIAAVGRAREIGVLRALGLADRSLRQTFLVEGDSVEIPPGAVHHMEPTDGVTFILVILYRKT